MSQNAVYSSMVRSGRTTYFIDVKEGKNGKRYLSISENHLDAEEKRIRSTVRVFSESVDQFAQALQEAALAVHST